MGLVAGTSPIVRADLYCFARVKSISVKYIWNNSREKYELNKLTSLPMCGFIAQLVEHRTGIAEVTGSNPVEALIFSGFFFPIA